MKFEISDIICFIIIFQLIIFSAFLFVRRVNYLSNYILGLQLIAQAMGIYAGFSFYHSADLPANFHYMMYIAYSFEFLWGPTFYLYVKSLVHSDFKLKALQLLHFLPFILVLFFSLAIFIPLGTEEKKIVLKSSAYLLHKLGFYPDIFIRGQVLFYIIQSVRVYYTVQKKIKEGHSSVSEKSLSWIRFLIAGYAVSFVISVPALLINLYILDSPAPAIKLMMMLPFLIYFNIIFFRAWLHPGIFADVAVNIKYKTSRLTKEEAELWIEKLNQYIALNKPYLAADLTLNHLAEALDISPRTLSQIINEYFNQNFIDYINRLRIEESKLMLLDSTGRKTVLEILYAVGFNNKSAYNIAFKRATGLTPTEFRKKHTN